MTFRRRILIAMVPLFVLLVALGGDGTIPDLSPGRPGRRDPSRELRQRDLHARPQRGPGTHRLVVSVRPGGPRRAILQAVPGELETVPGSASTANSTTSPCPAKENWSTSLTRLTDAYRRQGDDFLQASRRPIATLCTSARTRTRAGALRRHSRRSRPFPATSCGSTRRTWRTSTAGHEAPGPLLADLVRRRPGVRHRAGGVPRGQHDPHDRVPGPRGDRIGRGHRGRQSRPGRADHFRRRAGAAGRGLQHHGPPAPRFPPVAQGPIDPRPADQPGHDRLLSRSGAGGRSGAAAWRWPIRPPAASSASAAAGAGRRAPPRLAAARALRQPLAEALQRTARVRAGRLRQGHRPAPRANNRIPFCRGSCRSAMPRRPRWGPRCCWKTSRASACWTK